MAGSSPRVPLTVRARAYATVLALTEKQGWGYGRVARHVGLSPSTVYNWIVGRHSPLGSCNKPNLTSSPCLSYLAGAFLGDGSLIRSTSYHYELRLRVKDREFAEWVCTCLGSVIGRPKRVRADEKGFYIARAWSRLLYEYLSSLDSIRGTAEEFPAEFIRGFADAEGSAAISVGGIPNSNLVVLCRVSEHELGTVELHQAPTMDEISNRFVHTARKEAPQHVE